MTLTKRAEFADLCNRRGITRAVEVGTDRGLFAEQFLDRWKGEVLVCVDPWEPYPHMPFDRMPDLLITAALLARFRDRVRLWRTTSQKAAHLLPHSMYSNPGFVYLDGDHAPDAIQGDIAAWWPVVKSGGILAGHDYTREAVGVRRAVDTLVADKRLALHLTLDRNEAVSWWVDKP